MIQHEETFRRKYSHIFVLYALLIFLSTFFQSGILFASNSVTATKTSSGTTQATFTINYAQEIKWEANYLGSGNQGNDFYLHTDPANLNAYPLSTNLISGYNTGTYSLNPGTYSISINYFGMGPGSYTITYNLTASVSVSPVNHDFGPIDEGQQSSPKTFTISSTGDLPVKITSVVSSDPAHFKVTNIPVNQVVPTNKKFEVSFISGSTPGSKAANITISGVKEIDNSPIPSINVSVNGMTVATVPNISCIGGSCGSANYLGEADHTINQVATFNYAFTNIGNKSLVITDIKVINTSPLNPFSFASYPSFLPLSPGANRTVSIRFAPPSSGGEATYCGYISINSDDPDEPVKNCYFKAKAHHPVPIMVVSPTVIDYGEVELGFAFERYVRVINNGDALLNITITESTPVNTSQDLIHWSDVNTSTNIISSINPGFSKDFLFTYEPQDLSGNGSHTINLNISGNDLQNPSDEITLIGKSIPPIPIDAVLVLDRSGSMAQSAGSRKKIEALQKAASCFTNLLRTSIPNTNTGDRIGYVRYNCNSDVYLSLDYVSDANHLATANTKLDNNSLQNIQNGIKPDGATCIGGSMQTAAGMYSLPANSRKHVMVVLTDGKENCGTRIPQAYPSILQGNSNLKIYSVGLGDDYNSQILGSITNITNGYHQASNNLTDASIYDLELFYFKIYANATGMQLAIDPTVPVTLNGNMPVTVASATITSSDKSAVFLVLDEEYLRHFYKLELIDPNGQIIQLGTPIGGVPVHWFQQYNYTIYKVIFPDISRSHTYVGNWNLRLTPEGKFDSVDVQGLLKKNMKSVSAYINPSKHIVPVGFIAAVSSDYKMNVDAISSHSQPGATVNMMVNLTDRGSPLQKANVTVDVTTPSGIKCSNIILLNAGNGIWQKDFIQTGESGSYCFKFRSVGKNHRGELTTREDTRYVTLKVPEPEGQTKPCLPCWLLIFLWILLFLLLFMFLLRCCRKLLYSK